MKDEARVMSRMALPEETQVERQLRPQRLDEYVGQRAAVESLRVSVEAARQRREPLDHVLLSGPPGLGKTTLATIMANEMGAAIVTTAGPSLERGGDLMGILTNLSERDVLFIDEIHRLNPAIEEILYPAMEDFQLDLMIGEGPAARSVRIELPPFTLVGATTRSGLMTRPLRERFGIPLRMVFYEPAELETIVHRAARVLKMEMAPDGGAEIAKRSRGTPRVANRLLRRVRDYAEVRADGVVTREIARTALEIYEVDEHGLDRLDRGVLDAVVRRFGGGPVGLSTLAVALGEEAETVEVVAEPFLVRCGLLARTPRGRVATAAGWAHLGLEPPPSLSELPTLFD